VLAHSDQNINCTYISWSYTTGYVENPPVATNTAGSCYLKRGGAKLPTGSNYRGLIAGAARGVVVFSSVS
jgi:hypothetical protein